MTLEEARALEDEEPLVTYKKGQPNEAKGVIRHVGAHYVFVEYFGDPARGNTRTKATAPEDLTLG